MSRRVRLYQELTKPGIALYVVLTAAASFWVGSGGSIDGGLLARLVVGVWAATAGSLALNQYLERGLDARMLRTRGRPVPSGRIAAREARLFSGLLLVAGLGALLLWVGPLAAALTALASFAYNGVYTPMKTRSYAATLVGAVPGATPALIGWAAATGTLTGGAWVLFAMAFLWQLPHVIGLAWLLREDYARAGIRLAPRSGGSGRPVALQATGFCALLLPISLAPTLIGLTGQLYLIGAAVAGTWLLATAVRTLRGMDRAGARRVFLGSLAYQPIVLLLMVIDTLPR